MRGHKRADRVDKAVDDALRMVEQVPGMAVSPGSMSIPPNARDDFYQCVDRAQSALLDEVLPGETARAEEVASSCAKARDRVVDESDLVFLNLPQALEAYVSNPRKALERPLFGVVMDVVSGTGSRGHMRSVAHELALRHAETMRRSAVEMAAYLSIVDALRPARFWEVFSPDTVQTKAVRTGAMTIGSQVTSPERRIPEAVFETADHRLYAMKTELGRELDFYGEKIRRRRDMSLGGNSVDQVGHRVLLLYRMESLDRVPLLADRDRLRVRASDLMAEVVMPGDLSPGLASAAFLERIETMHPKRPVQVLLAEGADGVPSEARSDPRLERCQWRRLDQQHKAARAVAAMLDEGRQETENGHGRS